MNNVTYVLFAVCIVFAFVIVAAPPAFAGHSISNAPSGVTDISAGAEYTFTFNAGPILTGQTITSWSTPSLPSNCMTTGISISNSGEFRWTPAVADVGKTCDFQIVATITDDSSDTHESRPTPTVQYRVTSPPNTPPVIEFPDDIPTTAIAGQEISFTVTATDSDGDSLLWGIVTPGLSGLSGFANGNSYTVTWTPTEDQVGIHELTFRVQDTPPVVARTHSITVGSATAPVITLPIPDFDDTPRVGQTVTIDFDATDTESDTLEWAIDGPATFGQTIDSQTGLLTWTPRAEDVGTRIFSISVTDNVNDAVLYELTFTVAVNRLPTISQPSGVNPNPNVGETVVIPFTATDLDDDEITWLTFGGGRYHDDGTAGDRGYTLDQDGVFTWTPQLSDLDVTFVNIGFAIVENHQELERPPNGANILNNQHNIDRITLHALEFFVQNRAPEIEFPPDTPEIVYIDRLVSFELSATDEDGHSPSFTITTDLSATITPDGSFEWTPDASLLGTTQEVTFTAADNSPIRPRETTETRSFVVSEITLIDEVPVIVMYEPVILEGEAIPSLAGAVTDPIEFPEDEEIEYLIHKSSDLPDYISLNSTTGVFSGVFPFDTTATTTTLFFTWTYTDFHGESLPQFGSITVNDNPGLVPTVTRGNEGYDIDEYRQTVLDNTMIPPLSTVVTDYPTDPAETPVYSIIPDSGNLPASVARSLNRDTGAFSATFACDSARIGIPIVYTFDWTFADSTGESGAQQATITSQINSGGACITSGNDDAMITRYRGSISEGDPIPSLSTAVFNPPENPIDRVSVYTITDRRTLPEYIADSLDPQTGDFAAPFDCAFLPDNMSYGFEWTFEDGNEEYPVQDNAVLTVSPNEDCVPLTAINEAPTVNSYQVEVLEGQPIPRLSTAVVDPFEIPADRYTYAIDSSELRTVQYIRDSLDLRTGGFDEVFSCDTVSAGESEMYDFDWSVADGVRGMRITDVSTITVIDDPNCMTEITSTNDVPIVSNYFENVDEGDPIPSLSTAVFDPPESSTDGAIRYDITAGDLFTNPAYGYIVASLDHTTGDFGAVFNCGTLGNGQTDLGFTWTYTDGSSSGGNTQTAPSSFITVNNDNNCRTPENEPPVFADDDYGVAILEGQRIPPLSTVVTNPPEDPIDEFIQYTITSDPATQSALDNTDIPTISGLPLDIQNSLDPTTGEFSKPFPCDTPFDASLDFKTFLFTWTLRDGTNVNTNNIGIEGSPGSGAPAPEVQMGALRVDSNDQCTELINEEPRFRTYFSTVRPGGAIPGLSMAVTDPEEDPTDTSIAYRIINPGNLPEDIASTLVMGTGEIPGQFDDSYLEDVDSRSFVFTWSYQDDNREYEPRTAVLILAENSGGSSNDWKKKPTFGKSWEISSSQLVTDGFTFNDYTLDITDNWHTEFRRTSSIIGETNSVTLKAFSPDGFSYVALSLGVPEIGMATDAETDIILMLERNYENPDDYDITEIIHEQKESLVDESQTTATVTKVLCNPRDAVPCYSFDINFKVDAPLKSDVLAISAVDSKRRSTTTYINEGVEFTGEAILAPNTHLMVQKKTNQGPAEMLTLTQQDRRYNIWEDDSGYLWAQNDHGSWFSITAPEMERFEDRAVNVMTRMHSNFDSLKHDERQKATMMFDASKLVSVPDATFNYDYSGVSYGVSKMDQLAEELNIEQGKAQKIMELLR